MSKITRAALITLLIFSMCGCGAAVTQPNSAAQTAGASAAQTAGASVTQTAAVSDTPAPQASAARPVTDQAGRAVEIKGPVERIVSGYYISSSVCIALGLADKLVGIEAKAATRPIYALAKPELLKLPDTGTAKNFNLEACLALKPDLVILPYSLKDSADIMGGMGVPAILVNPENYAGLKEMITLIGAAAGAEEKAGLLTGYLDKERADLTKLTSGLTSRPGVLFCGGGSYLSAAAKDMYQADLIEMAGGRNAAGEITGGAWAKVSYEQLLAMNPEVMVIPSEAGYTKADILGDPQLSGLAAVKSGRVYHMPSDFEAWDSPLPSGLLGAKWLLSELHGDIYPLGALREDAAGYYKEFYGIDIDISLIGN